tara:strand:+ start:1241 stop:1888 length:648 start_codon:yes stop_codon:yes gene_type:complete
MALKINPDSTDQISQPLADRRGLFISIVFIALLFGILFLSFWINDISRNSGINTNDFEERLSSLEEQFSLADEFSTEFITDTGTQLQFLDKEIRKLWDLSNKRNRPNIEALEKSYKVLSNQFIATSSTVSKLNMSLIGLEADIAGIESQLSVLDSKSEGFQLINNELTSIKRRLLILDETIQAFDNYRKQTNQLLVEIQSNLNAGQDSDSPLDTP